MKTQDESFVSSVSESSYYLSEQAADRVRSGAMNVARLTEQRKSLSGKQLVSLALKRSANWTPTPGLPSRLLVCHQSPSSRRVSPCPRLPRYQLPSSPLSCPSLISQASCQRRASRQADWGQSFDEDPATCQLHWHAGGVLWRAWASHVPMLPHPSTHTHTYVLPGSLDGGTNRIGAQQRELPPLTTFLALWWF